MKLEMLQLLPDPKIDIDDVLLQLSVVQRNNVSYRREITLRDIIKLLADEIERRAGGRHRA